MVPAGFRWFSGGSFWRVFSLFFSKHDTALCFSESNDISPVQKSSTIGDCWRTSEIPGFNLVAFSRFFFSIVECFNIPLNFHRTDEAYHVHTAMNFVLIGHKLDFLIPGEGSFPLLWFLRGTILVGLAAYFLKYRESWNFLRDRLLMFVSFRGGLCTGIFLIAYFLRFISLP